MELESRLEESGIQRYSNGFEFVPPEHTRRHWSNW
jgi:hypothetical protein